RARRAGRARPLTRRPQKTCADDEGRSPLGTGPRAVKDFLPSELLRELVRVLGADGALGGAAALRLRSAAALPVRALDALARLEVLVDLEEVLDLQAVELRDVGELLTAHLTAVTHRHCHDLVVAARLIAHAEHAQRTAADQAAREGRLLEQHQAVQRIPILTEGPLDEPVIIWVPRRGEQHAIEPDPTVVMVHLVLVP